MTWDIAAVLCILAVALVLFVTEKLPMDTVALLTLVVLAVSGLVTLEEALAGFGNPAVVTVWAMFILSAGLSATGVADVIGRQVLRLAGRTEPRMILVIMLTAGGLSAFMNNIGVAALMLPVVMDIARRTGTPPSRLLMPMAYGSLLGGLTTLVGTPPNLVASNALRQATGEPFGFFEFSPIGVPALLVGSLFVAFLGRHLLPAAMPADMVESQREAGSRLRFTHDLETRRFQLRIAAGSPLDHRCLRESGLSALFGLQVIAVERQGRHIGNPGPDFVLAEGDLLTVQGREEEFRGFLRWRALEMARGREITELLPLIHGCIFSARVPAGSSLIGLTVRETDFQNRFGSHILAIRKGSRTVREGIAGTLLKRGDVLTLDGRSESLSVLESSRELSEVRLISEEQLTDVFPDDATLLELDITDQSSLTGLALAETGLFEALRLRVVGIARREGSISFPRASEVIRTGDKLLVLGRTDSLDQLRALQSLVVIEGNHDLRAGGRGDASGSMEVTLSPRSALAGKTLKELDFRRRYGLQVLSIWRHGRAYRSHLRNMKLEFGDALLLSGPRDRAEALAADEDFLLLSRGACEPPAARSRFAPIVAGAIMLLVIMPVLLGFLPIAVAAIGGSVLMVMTGCLTMEKAYRSIEWKSVFLIAGMIPLGTAMQSTGAAQWIAAGVASVTAPFGAWGIILGLYLLTALATTIVPTTALVLIMAPIGLQTAAPAGISAEMIMMAIAMAASASFTSPISHPANVLVMGPGGYRFVDYVKQGLLLAVVVMITVLPLLAWRY